MGDEYWYGDKLPINKTKAAINYGWVAQIQGSPQVSWLGKIKYLIRLMIWGPSFPVLFAVMMSLRSTETHKLL